MSQIRNDLSYYFHGISNRSPNVRAVIAGAETNLPAARELGGDIFNVLYQQKPELLDSDPSNTYAQVLRGVLKSPQFDSIRAATRDSIQWASIGASILLDEVAQATTTEEEYPQPPNDEQCDNPQPSNKDGEEESNTGSGESEDTGGNGEEENNESEAGESESNQESDDNNDDGSEGNTGNNPSDQTGEPNKPGDMPGNKGADPEESDEPGDTESDDSDSNGDESEDDDGDSGNDRGDSDSGIEPREQSASGNNDRPDPIDEPVDSAIEAAINKAGEKIEQVIAGMQPGMGNQMPTFDQSAANTELISTLAKSPQLLRVLAMIGRVKFNNNFMSAMHYGEQVETAGITYGRNIKNQTARDRILMMGDSVEFTQWMRKYSNGELQLIERKDNAKVGKGPMVVCIDTSSSMAGERLEWCKSLALALYMQCVKEKRPFAAIPFADKARPIYPTINSGLDPMFMMQVAGLNAMGGTSFQAPWQLAMHIINDKTVGNLFKQADVVFITDGEGDFNRNKIIEDMEKFNVRLISFFLGLTQLQSVNTYMPGDGYFKTQKDIDALRNASSFYEGRNAERLKYINYRHPLIAEFADLSSMTVFLGNNLDEATERSAFNIITKANVKVAAKAR